MRAKAARQLRNTGLVCLHVVLLCASQDVHGFKPTDFFQPYQKSSSDAGPRTPASADTSSAAGAECPHLEENPKMKEKIEKLNQRGK